MAGGAIADAAIAPSNRQLSISGTDELDQEIDGFLRRPGRGRRALRRAAAVFLRLLTKPPLRPFSRLARCWASLRTSPPSLASATACGFFPFRFFIHPLHQLHLRASERTARLIILSILIALLRYIKSCNLPQRLPHPSNDLLELATTFRSHGCRKEANLYAIICSKTGGRGALPFLLN